MTIAVSEACEACEACEVIRHLIKSYHFTGPHYQRAPLFSV